MAYGLRVFGDAGNVQLDETYRNFHLIGKGTASTNTSSTQGDSSTGTVTVTGCTIPILAVRCSTHGVTYNVQSVSGSTWTFRVFASGAGFATFEWFCFDMVSQPPSGKWGLRVFNSAGQVTFDSNFKPMRVVDFIKNFDLAGTNGTPTNVTKTYTAGRSYTAVTVRQGVYVNAFFTGLDFSRTEVFWFCGGAQAVADGVNVGRILTDHKTITNTQPGSIATAAANAIVDFIVIDLTDY